MLRDEVAILVKSLKEILRLAQKDKIYKEI